MQLVNRKRPTSEPKGYYSPSHNPSVRTSGSPKVTITRPYQVTDHIVCTPEHHKSMTAAAQVEAIEEYNQGLEQDVIENCVDEQDQYVAFTQSLPAQPVSTGALIDAYTQWSTPGTKVDDELELPIGMDRAFTVAPFLQEPVQSLAVGVEVDHQEAAVAEADTACTAPVDDDKVGVNAEGDVQVEQVEHQVATGPQQAMAEPQALHVQQEHEHVQKPHPQSTQFFNQNHSQQQQR